MGQFAYLINKETKISCEAYKISGGGSESLTVQDPEKLAKYLEHCRDNNLQIECVSEHYFTESEECAEGNIYEEYWYKRESCDCVLSGSCVYEPIILSSGQSCRHKM